METILLWLLLSFIIISALAMSVWLFLYWRQWRAARQQCRHLLTPQLPETARAAMLVRLVETWQTESPTHILFCLFPVDAPTLYGLPVHRRVLNPQWIPLLLEQAMSREIKVLYTLAAFTTTTFYDNAPVSRFLKDGGRLIKEIGSLAEAPDVHLLVIGMDTEARHWCHFAGRGIPV